MKMILKNAPDKTSTEDVKFHKNNTIHMLNICII